MKSYTLKLETILFELDGDKYVIKELTGKQRDQYLEEIHKRTRYDKSGKPVGMTSVSNIQGDLLKRCVYNADNVLVPLEDINGWPSQVVADIYADALRLSKLQPEVPTATDAETDAEKKD